MMKGLKALANISVCLDNRGCLIDSQVIKSYARIFTTWNSQQQSKHELKQRGRSTQRLTENCTQCTEVADNRSIIEDATVNESESLNGTVKQEEMELALAGLSNLSQDLQYRNIVAQEAQKYSVVRLLRTIAPFDPYPIRYLDWSAWYLQVIPP
eukprot:767945-Hanusia_phi.AAC.13